MDNRELAALKRVGPIRSSTTLSLVVNPMDIGRVFYTLYIMSDKYQGLDQQYQLPLQVAEGVEEVK
jgi:activating signal cointegrator complex subunit 3